MRVVAARIAVPNLPSCAGYTERAASARASKTFIERANSTPFIDGVIRIEGILLHPLPPVSPSDAKLRRSQSLALGNGTALKISNTLHELRKRLRDKGIATIT